MKVTPEIRDVLNETRDNLSGNRCRHFMAQVVETMLESSPMKAEKELGWNRVTLAKALNEFRGEFCINHQYQKWGQIRMKTQQPVGVR